MPDPVQLLRDVLVPEGKQKQPCEWEDLLATVREVTSAQPTREAVDLLVGILRFMGRFSLTQTSGRPHRLSPEDTLKSVAIQALGRWGAADRIPEIERIESTARSPALASLARLTIHQLRRAQEQSAAVEGPTRVSELHTARGGVDPPVGEGRSARAGRLADLAHVFAFLNEPVAEPLPMNPQATRRLNEAYEAYEARDMERALALLRRWGRHLPPAQLAYLLGSICYQDEDYGGSAMFYRRASELEPENTNYARVHLNALGISDPDEAEALAQRILANAQRHPPGLVVTAGGKHLESLQQMDDRDAQAAYVELSRIIEMALARLRSGEGLDSGRDPTEAMALAFLGFCRDHLGDFEGALRYYDSGLAAFPSNDALLVARGILRYATDTPGAVLDFQRAIQFGSQVVWPYFYMGHHFLVNNLPQECLNICERALKIHCSDAVRANLYEWIAISRSDLGFSPSEVRTAFEEAIRMDPANERIMKNRRAFEESLRVDALSFLVWEKPDGADMRAYGRAEYRLPTAA